LKRFVINIPTQKQRLSRTIKEMDGQGYDFTVFNAVTDEIGYKGISMSFRKIIIENYDQEYIHILEDDVKFTSKDSRTVFEATMNSLPKKWDIFLGGSYWYKKEEDLGSSIKLLDFSSLHSVVIKKKAFDKVLAHDYSIMENIDRYLGRLSADGKLNVYLCNPQVAIQYPGFSSNTGTKVNYTDMLKDKNILK
jgi:GR25 family glycosyltransferase involved in LPS biosynthesis